jgi:hypothetical protein
MELFAHTLDLFGKVLVSYTAIAVHYRFRKEHKMDESVFRMMKREQIIGIIGISFMVVAYLVELPFKL